MSYAAGIDAKQIIVSASKGIDMDNSGSGADYSTNAGGPWIHQQKVTASVGGPFNFSPTLRSVSAISCSAMADANSAME